MAKPKAKSYKEKLDIYRNALLNIAKLNGVYWDGDRKCSDPNAVASGALKKADPKLWDSVDKKPYYLFYVNTGGKFLEADEDGMLPEYDFSKGVRGKYAKCQYGKIKK